MIFWGWKYEVEMLNTTIIITIKLQFEWFHTSYDNIIVDHEKIIQIYRYGLVKLNN
jgi:hypothetical protein